MTENRSISKFQNLVGFSRRDIFNNFQELIKIFISTKIIINQSCGESGFFNEIIFKFYLLCFI